MRHTKAKDIQDTSVLLFSPLKLKFDRSVTTDYSTLMRASSVFTPAVIAKVAHITTASVKNCGFFGS